MNTKDINSYTTEELKAHLVDLKSGLKKLMFDHAISPVENPNTIRKNKKDIARVLTELKTRELTKA
jgi:large subunit ribosomal protein L29